MIDKIYKRIKKLIKRKELDNDRVEFYQAIDRDYRFMIEYNPELFGLLENAK